MRPLPGKQGRLSIPLKPGVDQNVAVAEVLDLYPAAEISLPGMQRGNEMLDFFVNV